MEYDPKLVGGRIADQENAIYRVYSAGIGNRTKKDFLLRVEDQYKTLRRLGGSPALLEKRMEPMLAARKRHVDLFERKLSREADELEAQVNRLIETDPVAADRVFREKLEPTLRKRRDLRLGTFLPTYVEGP